MESTLASSNDHDSGRLRSSRVIRGKACCNMYECDGDMMIDDSSIVFSFLALTGSSQKISAVRSDDVECKVRQEYRGRLLQAQY